jgi:hypothetical protein
LGLEFGVGEERREEVVAEGGGGEGIEEGGREGRGGGILRLNKPIFWY